MTTILIVYYCASHVVRDSCIADMTVHMSQHCKLESYGCIRTKICRIDLPDAIAGFQTLSKINIDRCFGRARSSILFNHVVNCS